MIEVTTHDELAGVRLAVSGHASEDFGNAERMGLCAGVSTLLATLLLELDGDLARGGDGRVDLLIPGERVGAVDWVMTGLHALARGYPGHLTIDQQDTRFTRRAST